MAIKYNEHEEGGRGGRAAGGARAGLHRVGQNEK